jgi:hypothetical protein
VNDYARGLGVPANDTSPVGANPGNKRLGYPELFRRRKRHLLRLGWAASGFFFCLLRTSSRMEHETNAEDSCAKFERSAIDYASSSPEHGINPKIRKERHNGDCAPANDSHGASL